jgi:ATP/maltotriose-dependent transcriptional regulator MalT
VPSPTSGAAGPQERTVIRAKVGLPPLSEARVGRPRVESVLADLIERHRVVVVAATAGAGKTTAVAEATQLLDRPLAWLTLGWTDAAPGRLVTYLEAALAGPLPRVAGVATGALAARIPHTEAAGLLVEAVDPQPVVLVIDELERIAESNDAWAVLEAVVRYAPAAMRVVLVSRRRPPAEQLVRSPGEIAWLGEAELAFTTAEAAEALDRTGRRAVDAEAAVEATGGWVTGVLFEAWRYADPARGGGDADPLHGYLSAHIVGGLPAADRDFLVGTSVLDYVTTSRALALGYADAAARLSSLRAVHLPASWHDGGRVLRCHPRFREYLHERLEQRGADEVRAMRLAHGRLLAAEGHDEEATEELLAAGAQDEALTTAGRAIFGVIDRLDLPVAERWLDQLRATGPLVMAELMLALATEDYRRGAALADELGAAGARAPLAASFSAAALLMGLCYAVLARLDDMRAVFAEAEAQPDADIEAMRYFEAIYGTDPPPQRPELTGGPLDALMLAVDYGYGRLAQLVAGEQTVGWVNAWAQPWLISALSATGRTQEAVELYEQVRSRGLTSTSIETFVGPHVLVDAGRRDEALAAITSGRRRAHTQGLVVYELLADVSEARMALRLDRDPEAALAVLDRLERHPHARRLVFIAEQTDAWYGFALLLAGRDEEAAQRLRRAAGAMLRSERILWLPTAAVYLAEAEWRLGDEEAADRAADVALDAARRQGSNHTMLQALADFPSVVSRRLDAEPAADSPWHELGRALIAQDVTLEAPVRSSVRLLEFGTCAIVVDDAEVRPRIAKTYELLAYLVATPAEQADRDELLDALFGGRTDDSSRAYLRQAVRWLRQVLPDGSVHVEKGQVRLGDEVAIVSESKRFEAALAQAARLRGADRFAATLEALETFDAGPYLPGVVSRWADDRRRRLTELATDARYEAAELAFAEGGLGQAKRLVEEVLRAEPYREAAWRLTMRLAGALGDEDGVIRAYQRGEQALAEVGATPGPTTRELLARLRR